MWLHRHAECIEFDEEYRKVHAYPATLVRLQIECTRADYPDRAVEAVNVHPPPGSQQGSGEPESGCDSHYQVFDRRTWVAGCRIGGEDRRVGHIRIMQRIG